MDLIIFLVALSILVLVHELGHLLAAKKVGVKVEEFGLGLPPRMVGKKIGETIYSLNWLPIGGFCKLLGEDPTVEAESKVKTKLEVKDKSRSFEHKKPWQKLIIVLGGVVMNLVLAVAVFSVVYAIVGVPVETDKVSIVGISVNSPAEKAGLKEGWVVLKVNDRVVIKSDELVDEVGKNKGGEVYLTIEGQEKPVKVAVRAEAPEGEGSMGVAVSNMKTEKIPWYRLDRGVVAGFKEAYFWGKIIVEGVVKMLGGLATGQPPKDVSGPIGMYQATSFINKNQGILAVIHFFGIVSVNLAVVNILPFPALDGGRIIFVFYEMITRKKANPKLEATINNLGMMLLLLLMLLTTVGDIKRLLVK